MEEKLERMRELVDRLNYASKMYYQNSAPIMTDFEYDKLYDELVLLEAETNTVLEDSPTINVETEVSKELEKVEHKAPMLSLGKTKLVDDLSSFLGNKEGILSWKLDGLTIVLTYNKGKLISGVTRGNGLIGEVVTNNVKEFVNVPQTIDYKGELILRGEAVIKYSDFEKINDSLSEDNQYKNPRNLCSGSVRQLDPKVTAKRHVNCIIFALISKEDEMPNSKEEQYKWLESLGFDVVERKMVNSENIYEAVEEYKEAIKTYDIPSDGLVLTYDDMQYGISLGSTAKAPRHSIAFKWKDETERTVLREIDWSVSRTGLINPVAVFDPVEIEGTIVSRASVHNVSIMRNLKLGINDEIEVYKANMIIPQIANNLTKNNDVAIPDTCPVCNNPTEIVENNGIKYLYCMNEMCHAKFIKKLDLFTSRNAMNIDGISEAILKKLFSEGLVNTYADLYHLDDYKDVIVNYEGFGEKSYQNMIDSIEKSRKVKVANFLYSLGIPEIGFSRAKLISRHCHNNIDEIINITEEELSDIEGVGEVIAHKYVSTMNNTEFKIALNKILKELEFVDTGSNKTTLENMSFVITGSLNHFDNRDALVEYIESNGGKVVSAISKNTSYLINNDINSTSTKNKKAKELEIPIITEEDLLDMTK